MDLLADGPARVQALSALLQHSQGCLCWVDFFDVIDKRPVIFGSRWSGREEGKAQLGLGKRKAKHDRGRI